MFVLQFGAVLVVVAVGVTAQPIDQLGPECQTGNKQNASNVRLFINID